MGKALVGIFGVFLFILIVGSNIVSSQDVECINENADVYSGESVIVNQRVTNKGETSVRLSLSVECDGGSGDVTPNSVLLKPDESEIVSIEVGGTNLKSQTNKDILSSKCVFTATDQGDGSQDFCNFNLNVKSQETCKPNVERICNNDRTWVLVCDSTGTKFMGEANCNLGCEITSEGAKCRGGEVNDRGNSNALFIIVIILLIIIIFALLFFIKLKRK